MPESERVARRPLPLLPNYTLLYFSVGAPVPTRVLNLKLDGEDTRYARDKRQQRLCKSRVCKGVKLCAKRTRLERAQRQPQLPTPTAALAPTRRTWTTTTGA